MDKHILKACCMVVPMSIMPSPVTAQCNPLTDFGINTLNRPPVGVWYMETFNPGGGTNLYATNLTQPTLYEYGDGRWGEISDAPISASEDLFALFNWDDGSGPALYVGTTATTGTSLVAGHGTTSQG